MRFISISKDCCYPNYITLCFVYCYDKTPRQSRISNTMCACIYSDSLQSCVSQDYGEISFITWQLLIAQELVCSIMVYFKKVADFAPSIKMITWTNIVLCFLNYSIFETWFVQTNWSTCGEWMGYFGFYNTHLWQSDVSRFFVDLRIGR